GSNTSVYDPATHTFSAGPDLSASANFGAHSFSITTGDHSGKTLVVLGNDGSNTSVYDPATHTFSAGPGLGANADWGAHSLAIGTGPKAESILTISDANKSTRIYNPATHTFSAGPNLIDNASTSTHTFPIESGPQAGKFVTMLGDSTPTINVYNPGKNVFNFTSISIPSGTNFTTQEKFSDNSGPYHSKLYATNDVTIAGTINLNIKGYSGGAAGTAGFGPGAAEGSTGGGCGGSHAVSGGLGGNADCTVNNTYTVDNAGSGGSGGANSIGGTGGGGIMISSNGTITVTASGSITANGGNAQASGASRGGGGSGGLIKLIGSTVTNNGTLNANGGVGGDGSTNGGGGGAGGRIVIQYTNSVTEGTITTLGGSAGTPNGSAGSDDTPNITSTDPIMYVLGGRNASNVAQSTISQTSINSDNGSLGEFTNAANALPQSLYGLTAQSLVIENTPFLYVLGGNNGIADQSTVYKIPLGSAGAVNEGSTQNQTQLPLPLSHHASVTGTVNDTQYLWVVGGISDGTAQDTIYRGTIDENGDIIALTTAGQATVPVPLYGHSAYMHSIENNNYLYILGGTTTGGTKQSVVYKATLDGSGNVSAITSIGQAQLTTAISGHAAFGFTTDSDDTHAYLVGGETTTPQSAIQKATVNADQTTYGVSRTNIPVTDLSNKNTLTFWTHSGRSGSFMTMEINTSEGWQSCDFSGSSNLTVDTANTWEQKACDISSISPRSAVTGIRFKLTSSHTSSFTVRIDEIETLTALFSGSAATSANSTALLGAADLTLNAQGSGAIKLNYDPIDSLAGGGGLAVYDGGDTSVFSVDGEGDGYVSNSMGIGTTDVGEHTFYIAGGTAYCDQSSCWLDASSRDLKTNIEQLSDTDMTSVSDEIRNTNVYFYNRIEDPDGLQYLGVIAEEAPSWITTPDKKAISASAFANFLLAGLKSLQNDIDEMKTMMQLEEYSQSGESAPSQNLPGVAILEPGENSVLVGGPYIAEDAQIFLTPEEPIVVSAKRVNGVTFEIRTKETVQESVTIHWWIVN
ncbi:MAG: tail fiber domain-containing protein, partial [Patescibacteria group bacterium]